jgi:hypothetical protein
MTLPDAHEASSRGAVLLALETIGKIENIEDIPPGPSRKFTYSKARQSLYRKARERHEAFYRSLIEQ